MLNINLRIGEKLGFLLGLVSLWVGFQNNYYVIKANQKSHYEALSFGIFGLCMSHFTWKCLQFNQISLNTSSTNLSWLSPKQFDWFISNFAQTEWCHFTGWGNWGKWFRWLRWRTLSTFVNCCQTDLWESISGPTNQKLEYLIGVTVNKTFDKVVMVCCQITIETNPSIGLDLLSFNQIT